MGTLAAGSSLTGTRPSCFLGCFFCCYETDRQKYRRSRVRFSQHLSRLTRSPPINFFGRTRFSPDANAASQITARSLVLTAERMRLLREILVRKQLYDARNRPTDATVHIDSWVVASYRTCDNRSTAPNQL